MGYAVTDAQVGGFFQYVNPDVPAGNTVASSALIANAETAFASNTAIPVEFLSYGHLFKVRASGLFGSSVASLPLTVRIKLNGTVIATTTVTPVVALSTRGWTMDVYGTWKMDGTLEVQGVSQFATTGVDSPNIAPLSVSTGFPAAVTVTAQWGSLAVGGSITMSQLLVMAS